MSMNFQKSGLPGLLKFNKALGYNTVELQTGPEKKRFTVVRGLRWSHIPFAGEVRVVQ